MAERIWPDGYYKLWLKAVDQEGNVEIAPFDKTGALVLIDTVAPTATMDANPQTTEVETTATVQRNSNFTLFARTNPTNEDDEVTFKFKRERDLNTDASYGMIMNAWGVGPEDGNPDHTRPYSFDLRLGVVSDPTDPNGTTPLHVGESYDFVVKVDDEVGNTTTHIENRAANRHITLNIIDTIAPHMTIVAVQRAAGDHDADHESDDAARLGALLDHGTAPDGGSRSLVGRVRLPREGDDRDADADRRRPDRGSGRSVHLDARSLGPRGAQGPDLVSGRGPGCRRRGQRRELRRGDEDRGLRRPDRRRRSP